ncbi:helix-turn-helix transcriptional regulator ImmR [Faecalicatena orotica]|uniref:Helix-turn-helix protein n=1 Tax=Faecalicatena orotica TaxID=1544 RepID=A0A2Y9BES5_9FIRM|nr:helix-turn-helix transcriptional regulator [Faecalicatena orotica]PWJ29518.1 helix-turn-helix protein [Faecalicatena orotica]SSA55973.1 Helix-turn-helix [Faecalicatena orotica]
MSIGKNIQFYRIKIGYTQKELSEKLGIATGTIQQYELDKREPKFEMIQRIAEKLETSPYNLYGIDEDITDFNFSKACDWLDEAGYTVEPQDEHDSESGVYQICSFDEGTICRLDAQDIIALVEDCRKQAEADTDEQTVKYIKLAIKNQK